MDEHEYSDDSLYCDESSQMAIETMSDKTIKYWINWPLTDDVRFNNAIRAEAQRRNISGQQSSELNPIELNSGSSTTLPIDEQLLKDALIKWGKEAQIMVAIEECSELIMALSQSFRPSKKPDIVTEIADVLIMASQLRLIYGPKKVDAEIVRKLNRLKESL